LDGKAVQIKDNKNLSPLSITEVKIWYLQANHPQLHAVHRPHTPFAGFLLHGVFFSVY
jgi:hypothetical protein